MKLSKAAYVFGFGLMIGVPVAEVDAPALSATAGQANPVTPRDEAKAFAGLGLGALLALAATAKMYKEEAAAAEAAQAAAPVSAQPRAFGA